MRLEAALTPSGDDQRRAEDGEAVTRWTLGDLLRNAARPANFGAKPAVYFEDGCRTYGQLNAEVNRLANGLLTQGIAKGDRVAVLGRNSLDYIVIYFALAKAGAIMVPVNYRYKPGEIAYTLAQSESCALILESCFRDAAQPALAQAPGAHHVWHFGCGAPENARTLGEIASDASETEPPTRILPDDPHIILYTSGTTGFPKGAVLTHHNHVVHALAVALQTRMSERETAPILYPLFHTGGPDCVLLPHVLMGGTVVVLERPDPERIVEAVTRHRCTSLFCVPTLWKRLLAHLDSPDVTADLSSVTKCLGSSDVFSEALLDALLRHFDATVQVTYGLTEAGCILTFSRLTRDDRSQIASVGRPHPLVEVRVADERGREVEIGAAGEVQARGPTLMTGYWNMPGQTAEAFRDGWLKSGDLARRNDDGTLSIVGRMKDLIISGGENIYPIEIEKLLRDHPAVRDCAVIGVPDPEWSESVLAVVVPEDGTEPDPAAVRNFVADRLAGYKKPRYVEFVEALPVTSATEKVQKAVLRKRFGPKYAALASGGREGELTP